MNEFSHIELDENVLVEKTLKYIYSIENTYQECALYLSILNPLEKYEDLKLNESFLKERLSKLKFIIDYDEVRFENRIQGFSDDTFEQAQALGNKMFAIENFSKEIFWANKDEEKIYLSISNFNFFSEQIIFQEKLYKSRINILFNVEALILYYQKLLVIKFPEFSEEIILGKSIIRFRPMRGDYFLGIETDYQSCKSKFRKGEWEEPNYKFIIFKILNVSKIERIVIFDKFIHPHFDPPAYSFGWYFYAKNTVQVDDRELSLKYIVEKEFLGDGTVKLSMSEEFGEDLKRHAYFYYDMLYHTTKEFITFVEKSFESGEDE